MQHNDSWKKIKEFINDKEREKFSPFVVYNHDAQSNPLPQEIKDQIEKQNFIIIDTSQNKNVNSNKRALASIQLRMSSILAGLAYMQSESNNYFNNVDINKNINDFFQEIKEKQSAKNPETQIDEFVLALAESINKKLPDNEKNIDTVIRKIRNAEKYYVAAHPPSVAIFKSEDDKKNIYQFDLSLKNKLTENQKKDLQLIHSEQPPAWFNILEQWEQNWLKARIPEPTDANQHWNNIEDIFQSSAMQHIPGIKNARQNFLYYGDDKNSSLLSTSIKTATLVPYEMPLGDDPNSMIDSTKYNAEQLINKLSDIATKSFENKWGKVFNNGGNFKPPILIQSLLSDTIVDRVAMGSSDTKLVEGQKRAIDSIKKKYQELKIYSANDPVNFQRFFNIQQKSKWTHADRIIKQAESFLETLEKIETTLTTEQKSDKDLIKQCIDKLKKLKDKSSYGNKEIIGKGRNVEQFKVAYLSLLVEAMGGAVSTNCKSGKDRTGIDEIYRHAMLLYFKKNKKLPIISDDNSDRSKFIEKFKLLFDSMKTQHAASLNTPGSFGLKDSAKAICRDIRRELGDSYLLSNQLSNMNKPKCFQQDEKKQSKEQKKYQASDADRVKSYQQSTSIKNETRLYGCETNKSNQDDARYADRRAMKYAALDQESEKITQCLKHHSLERVNSSLNQTNQDKQAYEYVHKKDNIEEYRIRATTNNINILISSNTDEVIKKSILASIDLYLASLKNANAIQSHRIDSNNPTLKQITIDLLKKRLIDHKMTDHKINGVNINDLNNEAALNQSNQRSFTIK